jgi:hypothetical protein
MTTLIDRYLHSVKGFLPNDGQADIIRELSEDLHAQVAEREDALGRRLTDAEQEDLLKQYGHPMLLASRYRTQRHLIGPAMFPFYLMALKASLGIALVVHGCLALSMFVAGKPTAEVFGPLAAFPFGTAVTIFGWVTIGFTIADLGFERARGAGKWAPRALPDPSPRVSPRVHLIFEVAAATAFFFWWLAIPRFHVLLLGPAAAFATLAPVWDRLFLPVTLVWMAGLAVLWALLLNPAWRRLLYPARIVLNLAGIVLASLFLRADALIEPIAGGVMPGEAAQFVRIVELAARLSMGIFIAGSIVEIVKAAWKLWRRTDPA